MSTRVHTNRTCLLNQPPHPQTEETQDEYSDGGYPTLPRPKVILPIPRPDSPWSAHEASQLQTVSLRLLNGKNQRARTQSPIPAKSLLSKEHCSTIVRSGSVTGRVQDSSSRKDASHVTRTQRTACRKEVGHRKPIEAAISNLQRARCSPPIADIDSDSLSRSLPTSASAEALLSCSKAKEVDATNMSQGKAGKKASKRPARALSFSFGTNSSAERKRRTLNLFGTMRRRPSPQHVDDTSDIRHQPVAVTSPIAPASPILVGKRRSRTLPSNLRVTSSIQQQSIREERGSISSLDTEPWSSKEDRGPVVVGKNHFGSCRELSTAQPNSRVDAPRLTRLKRPVLPLFVPTSTAPNTLPLENRRHRTLDLSPADADVSSMRESIESLTHSVCSDPDTPPTPSTPSSGNYCQRSSPGSQRASTRPPSSNGSSIPGSPTLPNSPRHRKLSDPGKESPLLQRAGRGGGGGGGGGRDSPASPLVERSPRTGRILRKGHTFCVRSTREGPNWREMRHHIVRFLLETEQSYVQSLRTIIKVYLEPLRRPQVAGLTDPNLVRDIFYQIPEICSLHERFLAQVTQRVEYWHPLQKIGDIFVNTFSKCQLMDIYSRFIQNFMRAKAAIDIAKQSRPLFARFLEQRARDIEGKLSLDDLLIKPVQRIPRYALFIKDLLKHTSASHPDHSPLLQALGELTTLAERVNESQRESHRLERQRELLTSIDGLALLLNSLSSLLRYDLITEIKGNVHKKDRFLILFSDVVVCASARRRSTSFKRGSLLNLNSVLPEALRYKIKWHAPLTELSIAQVQAPLLEHRRQNTLEKMIENLRSDEAALQEILDLSNSLHKAHQPLSLMVREMLSEVREGVGHRREELENLPQETARIDLVSYASSYPLQYSVIFPSQRIRDLWEKEFLVAKEKADKQAPPTTHVAPPTSPPPTPGQISHSLQFLNPLLLQSGRIGTQLTCAAVGLPVDCESTNCLWVCCSDGYGGQVCLLNLEHSTQPQLVANITVSDSQILCIAAIPCLEEKEEGSVQDKVTASITSETAEGRELELVTELLRLETSTTLGNGEGSTSQKDSEVPTPAVYPESRDTDYLITSSSPIPVNRLPSSDSSSDLSSQISVSRTPSSTSEDFPERKEQAQRFQGEEEEGGRRRRHRQESESPDNFENGSSMDESSSVRTPVLKLSAEGSKEEEDEEKGNVSVGRGFPFLRGEQRAVLFQRPSRSSFPSPPKGFCRVRSNSAPPDPDRGFDPASRLPAREVMEVSRSPSPPSSPPLPRPTPIKNSLSVDPRMTKAWSPLTLRPSSNLEGGGSADGGYSCMWLGTEGGQIHVYIAGNNLRSRSKRQTIEMGAPVHCIRYHEGKVYAGLGNGSVAILNPQDAATSGYRHCVALGSEPVVSCVPVCRRLWAACGGTIYQLDHSDGTGKPVHVATLPSEQSVHTMVAIGNNVWVSVKSSPVLHLYHAITGSPLTPSLLTTVDCTGAAMDMLKGYDAIIRQHKSSGLRITSLLPLPSSNSLLVGTSAGSILYLPLPPIDFDPGVGTPPSLPHPPSPIPLLKGHVDNVHFLSSMRQDAGTLVLSGGSGFEDFATAGMSQGFPETASCVLIWKTRL